MSWPVVKLGDICNTTQGVQITKANTSDTAYEGGYRYLYIADFLSDKKQSFVDDNYDHKKVTSNDLVMANTGSPGRVFKGKDGILSNNLFKISFDQKEVDRNYLYILLSSEIFQKNLQRQMKGGIQKHLGHQTIARQEIPLPPLAEQKRIAAILDKADQLRQKRQQTINLADEFLRSVFLEMFGDPVTNPKGWEFKSVGDVLRIKHGYAFKSEFFKSAGDHVLLTPGNFFEKGGYRDRGDKQKYYVGEIPREYILKEGDLLVAMTEQAAGLLGSSILVPTGNRFLHNQRLGLIENDSSLTDRIFLAHLFNQQSVRGVIHDKATGIKVRHTSPTKIEAIEIGLPPLALQEQFAQVVRHIDATQGKRFAVFKEMATLFNSLSQKAFAGQL